LSSHGSEQPLPGSQSSALPDARVESSAARAPASPEAAPASLSEQLKQAESEGLAALEALAKANPNDGAVLLALAQERVNSKKYAEAVNAVSAALEVEPELNVSKKVASLLFTTAQSKSGRERTFSLLEGPMGSRGADIVYDIAVHPTIKPQVKTRAEKYLASEAFERASSPELNIAVALLHANRCEQKYALLLRAKNVGDSRSLKHLDPLVKTDGCGAGGKQDCYPCMRADSRLADARSQPSKRARLTSSEGQP
jgi:tetratricopeptide (TPR) repeat protein